MTTVTHHIWIGFAGGIVAFAHCVGMCGGFALHLSRERNTNRMLTGQFLWLVGKLFSYIFLGALAGFAGSYFQLLFLRHGLWQNLLSYAAAGVIFLTGLSLLGLLPVRGNRPEDLVPSLLSSLGGLFSASSPGSALALGVVTGLLPCPVVLAFIAYALQTGSVLGGMAVMGSLGLGTAIPLLGLGGAARLTGWHRRSWAPLAGGAILIVLSVSTALRASAFFHKVLGCPPKPVLQQSAATQSRPCCAGTGNDPRSGN